VSECKRERESDIRTSCTCTNAHTAVARVDPPHQGQGLPDRHPVLLCCLLSAICCLCSAFCSLLSALCSADLLTCPLLRSSLLTAFCSLLSPLLNCCLRCSLFPPPYSLSLTSTAFSSILLTRPLLLNTFINLTNSGGRQQRTFST
jgi:hypothetical protein